MKSSGDTKASGKAMKQRPIMNSDGDKSVDQVAAIEFRNVSVSFDGITGLEDVSFVLRRKQMIAITGVSQSGKSVLLHLAIGLLRPDQGQILVEGEDIAARSEEELLVIRARLMGLVFQEDTLFTSLSAFDNTAYRPREQGQPEEKLEQDAFEILRFVGFEQDAMKLHEELSIGMLKTYQEA